MFLCNLFKDFSFITLLTLRFMNIIIESIIKKEFTFEDLSFLKRHVLSMIDRLYQLYQLTGTFHSCLVY